MSSAAVGTHSGAGPLGLMSCVRESSPLQDFDSDTEKSVATKKKFWNRLKWFKRKNKVIEDNVLPVSDYMQTSESQLRSRSTSELSIEEPPRKRNGSSMYPGLSVSHDSVFHSPQSGSETDLDVGHSSSSLCIPNQPHAAELQTELSERLRLRRSGGGGRGDTSEDDEGFPHSLCNSPTTTDNIDKTALKDLPNKSHSTCSDGSLLSVGSSDIEEDLIISQIRHKSNFSEHKHDLDLNTTSIPLNHSAAHHRVSVRPKKTHGVPRRRRVQQIPNTLPTTIEVNEDSSIRSTSPDAVIKVPPGHDDGKLNRSRSNAGSKSQDALEEHSEKEENKSFFERLFPRRSAKKKKAKNDEKKQEEKKMKLETEDAVFRPIREETGSNRKYETKPVPALRTGAAYRQRMVPADLVDSSVEVELPDVLSTSPLHLELETRLKQRLTVSSPPQSLDYHEANSEETSSKPRCFDDSKHKMRLAGLSALQQKVLILNTEDEGDFHNFKSLTEFPSQTSSVAAALTKSHSFKGAKTSTQSVSSCTIEKRDSSIGKSSSLDSMKLLEGELKKKTTTRIVTEKVERRREIKQKTVEVNCDVVAKENDLEEISRQILETKSICDAFSDKSSITISGPSHTAVVNVKTDSEYFSLDSEETRVDTTEKTSPKEQQISITKINVQSETETSTPTSPITVESKSKRFSEQRSRPVFNFELEKLPRKFSQDNVEIVEKDSPKTPPVFLVPSSGPLFKKNEKTAKKTSVVSVTPESPTKDKSIQSFKSSSCDSLASEHFDSTDRSSQDSLDKSKEPVVLRRKSTAKDKGEEEPELMKVFARRSLKLKDPENESLSQQLSTMMSCDKTRDSDKENQDSPVKERKRSEDEAWRRNGDEEDSKKLEEEKKEKEPLTESNVRRNSETSEHQEVALRKPSDQNPYVRCLSVNSTKMIDNSQNILRKQFMSRRKTDNWITNIKNESGEKDKDGEQAKEQTGNELIIEPKNFNQRKAEWEKRAQEAQKKSP